MSKACQSHEVQWGCGVMRIKISKFFFKEE